MSLLIMLGCRAYGDAVIQQRDQVVARSGNVESFFIMKLLSTMESDIKELRDKIKEQQSNYEEELKELKAKLEDQPTTVYAQIELRGYYTYTSHSRVKFTSTVANVGNAYNNVEGYFMAPYDGTYLFTVSFCVQLDNWVKFHIFQDHNIIYEGSTGDQDWHTCSSKTVVTYMMIGSKVWIETYAVRGGKVDSTHGIPSFTGVLLNTFQKP